MKQFRRYDATIEGAVRLPMTRQVSLVKLFGLYSGEKLGNLHSFVQGVN